MILLTAFLFVAIAAFIAPFFVPATRAEREEMGVEL